MTDEELIDWLLETEFIDMVTKLPTNNPRDLFLRLDELDLYPMPPPMTHLNAAFMKEVAETVRAKVGPR